MDKEFHAALRAKKRERKRVEHHEKKRCKQETVAATSLPMSVKIDRPQGAPPPVAEVPSTVLPECTPLVPIQEECLGQDVQEEDDRDVAASLNIQTEPKGDAGGIVDVCLLLSRLQ